MSTATTSHRAWDDASGAASDEPVRRFEAAWRKSPPNRRPDPLAFVGEDASGVRLALLRADLGLRWESGERAGAERYRGLGLSDDAMVALAYEEFCLREDHGEPAEPSRFYERFPELAPALRRVLEIHDLIGSGRATSTASMGLSPSTSTAPPFPEAGQTIAGFHLVEELGRGGFARVFLARERQLADRPVALKVARAGSREPQTLARLQHTHIVPVHSYRIDPATGLHLLCMPYFGRVTLSHVLADKAVKDAIAGAELVAALDRLDAEGATSSSARPAGRLALAARPYARAIAWWGARLAEALQHAHDRGVLHRDIKPSNILVTADGMPMLLDFNLAHEPLDGAGGEPATLGGTVAYMSPEHLEALAEGRSDGVDGRSDVYALGVVLFEAMGSRPFGPPPASRSVPEALLRAAEERKNTRLRLRDVFPEAPAALEAVVARCLAPEPEDRYASAGELAEDLQAVADDLPLPHAREPIGIRVMAKVRRHRRAMAATAIVLLTLGLAGFIAMNARMTAMKARHAEERLHDQVQYYLDRGEQALEDHRFPAAEENFGIVHRLTAGRADLHGLRRRAELGSKIARSAALTETNADEFFRRADALWPVLLGLNADRPAPAKGFDETLHPFFVLENPDWTALDDVAMLDTKRRERLVREVHELLFLGATGAAGSSEPELRKKALALCDRARTIRASRLATGPAGEKDARSLPEGPWEALRRFVETDGRARCSPPPPSLVATPWEAYMWGRVLLLESPGETRRAVAWLEQAGRRHEGKFWIAFDVAYQADRAGLTDVALEHYNAAVDLRPDDPRARAHRARLYVGRGAWSRALDDLDRALVIDPHLDDARLELGVAQQALGRVEAARKAFDLVIDSPSAGSLRDAAMLDRAKLDFDAGRIREARAALDALLEKKPVDPNARLARAIVSLRAGDFASAEVDLDRLIAARPRDAEAFGYRSICRLKLGRGEEALADAARAMEIDPTSRRERLCNRALLAVHRYHDMQLDDPAEVRLLPAGGPSLATDLRAAVDALRQGRPSPVARGTRAVILSALGDRDGAEAEATLAVEAAPSSPRVWLVRARVRRERGDDQGAKDDVARGLQCDPDDSRLLGLGALLRAESGDPSGALADLDRAIRLVGGAALDRPRAEIRTRLGLGRAALADWNRVIERDASDPTAYLGRARAFARLSQWDQVAADLERAADLAGGRPEVLSAISLTYARSLAARPDHLGRVASLAGRMLAASLPTTQAPQPAFRILKNSD